MTEQIERAKARLATIETRISELERWSRFTSAQLVALMGPLSENRVSHRTQSGSSLSYVEAHDIKNMLIRIFGFGGFSSDVIRSEVHKSWEYTNSAGKPGIKVLCSATVQITIHPPSRETAVAFAPVTYSETAVSSQSGNDEGDVADFAMKTAESDAFKRAAIFLGTQFGLSLYANGSKEDQVAILFDPVQKELLALGQERLRIIAFLSAQQPAGAVSTPIRAPGATGAPNGAPAGDTASLQAALHSGD